MKNAQEMFATDFLNLSFNEQDELIINCLIHSAKMIDTKTKKADAESMENGYEKAFRNGLKESALSLVNDADVKQSAWMYALESANDAENFDKPLLYMVSVATSKALSKAIYGDIKKSNTDTIDTETPIAVYFDNVETTVLNEMTRVEIFDYLPNKTRVQIITMLDLMQYGYKADEICEYFGIREKTLASWKSAVVCAIARHKADNKEYKDALALLDSTKAKQNESAFKAAQKAVYDALNGCESYNKDMREKTEKKNKALTRWLNADYMERIRFITYHKDDFKTIFNIK